MLRACGIGLAALVLGGCVERALVIRSDPPGAEVYVDGEHRGRTPLRVPFHWYGSRGIELRKPGYRTIRRVEPVGAPWYQVFPLDLLTDLLLPFRITDERVFEYTLEPQGEPEPFERVRERADELRRRLESGP